MTGGGRAIKHRRGDVNALVKSDDGGECWQRDRRQQHNGEEGDTLWMPIPTDDRDDSDGLASSSFDFPANASITSQRTECQLTSST